MEVSVRQGSLNEVLEVLGNIPEFDGLKEPTYYSEIIKSKKQLILVATCENQIIGCKAGYERDDDGSFYSWLGGVLPDYRKHGVAQLLSDQQEEWTKVEGYDAIKFKTLNRHKAMLHFALRNGFNIYNVIPKDDLKDYRIELIKHLA